MLVLVYLRFRCIKKSEYLETFPFIHLSPPECPKVPSSLISQISQTQRVQSGLKSPCAQPLQLLGVCLSVCLPFLPIHHCSLLFSSLTLSSPPGVSVPLVLKDDKWSQDGKESLSPRAAHLFPLFPWPVERSCFHYRLVLGVRLICFSSMPVTSSFPLLSYVLCSVKLTGEGTRQFTFSFLEKGECRDARTQK